MNEKWNKMSKVEKFCVLLGVAALAHFFVGGDIIVAGAELLIIVVVFVVYKAITNRNHTESMEGQDNLETSD